MRVRFSYPNLFSDRCLFGIAIWILNVNNTIYHFTEVSFFIILSSKQLNVLFIVLTLPFATNFWPHTIWNMDLCIHMNLCMEETLVEWTDSIIIQKMALQNVDTNTRKTTQWIKTKPKSKICIFNILITTLEIRLFRPSPKNKINIPTYENSHALSAQRISQRRLSDVRTLNMSRLWRGSLSTIWKLKRRSPAQWKTLVNSNIFYIFNKYISCLEKKENEISEESIFFQIKCQSNVQTKM